MSRSERDALLILTLTPGFGPVSIRRCIERFGSAAKTLEVDATALARIDRISLDGARGFVNHFRRIEQDRELENELESASSHGARILIESDDDYPRLLKLIPDPPLVLYVRGELRADDALAVGLVGSRKCSAYGREQADRIAAQCAQAGLCIVSGGALGVDGAAHRAALRVGGRTIAVIGSGLTQPYPDRHAELFDTIANGHGAVVSEFPMTTPPNAQNFPRRNRIISGLSLGIVVVEAARRSGALITARQCVTEHHRECMAVPGRVDSPTSAGCHQLIRDGGAALVTSAAEVMDELGEAGELLKAELKPEGESPPAVSLFEQNLSDTQRQITEQLDSARTLDEMAALTGLPISVLQADLTMLQVRGLVAKNGGRFKRKR